MPKVKNKQEAKVISHEERQKIFDEGLALEKELNKKGQTMYSDDLCCKILAYLLCFGGGNENVVYGKIAFPIKIAQYKLNLYGGERPNKKLLPVLQKYIQEISVNGSNVPWLSEISERFNVKIPEYSSLPEYGRRETKNFELLLSQLILLI